VSADPSIHELAKAVGTEAISLQHACDDKKERGKRSFDLMGKVQKSEPLCSLVIGDCFCPINSRFQTKKNESNVRDLAGA
jgi:hypothetical protein